MFIDAETSLCSTPQAITATKVFERAYDTGGEEMDTGEQLGVGIVIAGPAAVMGTYTLEVIQSASDALSDPTVVAFHTIPAADLKEGSLHVVGVPATSVTARYLGLRITLGGTSPSLNIKVAWIAPLSFFTRWKVHTTCVTVY